MLERYTTMRRADIARADYRAGVVAMLLYNTNRPKGAQARAAEDFFPALKALEEEPAGEPEVDVAALLAHARAVNAALGGEDLTSGHDPGTAGSPI